MVPTEVIDEIRNRVDLVRLIGEVVPLKKSGRNYSGLCPFHQEKSASFTVSEQKQLYHCFGCGEGGTVFTFFMKFHHYSFPETLEKLAGMAGIDLSQYQKEAGEIAAKKEAKNKLLKVMAYARDQYHWLLMDREIGKSARDYAKGRGLNADSAKRLHLGFAPEAWDTLVRACERDGISLEDAQQTGLVGKKSSGGYYDIFRSRLLFPIQDAEGNTVGFGGRIMGDGAPKYLNSPQSILFDKGRLLFGLQDAQEAIRREKKIIVVEGYLDQVTLFEHGIENVVATLGTALTDSHAKLLKKYAGEIIVLFDGDEAGRKASRRSVKPLLSEGLRAHAALLPQGIDPDVFVRTNGKEALLRLMDEAVPILEFFVLEFYRNESDVMRKAQAIEELAGVIRETSSVYIREALVNEACKLTGVEPAILRGEKKSFVPVSAVKMFQAQKSQTPAGSVAAEELMLLRLAAEVPQFRERLLASDDFTFFSSTGLAETARRWVEKLGATNVSAATVVDLWDDETTRSQLIKVFVDTAVDYAGSSEKIWTDCMRKLGNRELSRLTQEVAAAESSGKTDVVRQLSMRMQDLKRRTA